MAIYGYARISTRTQNIERQIRNILAYDANAKIYQEAYTGTKVVGRKELNKLLSIVKSGDTIIFDSVSRMSRNAEDGWELYQKLFAQGVELVFLKEQHINTAVYRESISRAVPMTGGAVDCILQGINAYLMILAEQQIKIAFDQAQKEVDDLHKRTSEGMLTAKLNGKQIGQIKSTKLTTKKSITAKETIRKHSNCFGGNLSDGEVMKLTGLSRNTYYKYKKELTEELA